MGGPWSCPEHSRGARPLGNAFGRPGHMGRTSHEAGGARPGTAAGDLASAHVASD